MKTPTATLPTRKSAKEPNQSPPAQRSAPSAPARQPITKPRVRPRASGYLQRVHFADGQYVRSGQLLFSIDARPNQAALDQARAQLARAHATLANAKTEFARSATLAASEAASTEEVEQRRAAVRAGEADVAAAQAA